VPNSDFFEAINSRKASIVTDHIDTFTEKGILLKSGEELDADIIVTATGLDLLVLGGIEIIVDGETVDISKTFSYKAMMFSGSTFGYINASWTLRADLTAEYFCRLINHMDATGYSQCTPRLGDQDTNMPERDWITAFSSGYMQRAMHMLPKQGDREPWLNTQNYDLDRKLIRGEAIDDGVLAFSNPQQGSMEQETGNVESNTA